MNRTEVVHELDQGLQRVGPGSNGLAFTSGSDVRRTATERQALGLKCQMLIWCTTSDQHLTLTESGEHRFDGAFCVGCLILIFLSATIVVPISIRIQNCSNVSGPLDSQTVLAGRH